MPKSAKNPDQYFIKIIRRLSSKSESTNFNTISDTEDYISELDTRVKEIILFFSGSKFIKSWEMICFIMYDIEDHRIRHHISKYLLKKGCTRVQKSVFVGKLERKRVKEMQITLSEIQAMYDNNDSIFFLPAGEENISGMHIIGKNIDFEFTLGNLNTLFI